MENAIDWKVFAAGMTVVFGLLGIVWNIVQSHRAEVFKKMLEQSEVARQFETSVVRDYVRTDHMRHMFESALEPLKVDLRYIRGDLDRLKERDDHNHDARRQ